MKSVEMEWVRDDEKEIIYNARLWWPQYARSHYVKSTLLVITTAAYFDNCVATLEDKNCTNFGSLLTNA
ncbi:unnamed protein product, partial [Sphenostylis stenocarpa]